MIKKIKQQLLNCAICGEIPTECFHIAIEEDSRGEWWVECWTCNIRTHTFFDNAEHARFHWNEYQKKVKTKLEHIKQLSIDTAINHDGEVREYCSTCAHFRQVADFLICYGRGGGGVIMNSFGAGWYKDCKYWMSTKEENEE